MRLRNKKWTKDFIKKNEKYLINPNIKNNIYNLFENNNEVNLEIGCGKGIFIIENANRYKNINFIAMEKETTIIGVALKNYLNMNLKNTNNLYFLNSYAENLLNIFEKETFNKIYLNFSDPWPKSKHYKKRLTHISFLNMYYSLLKENGIIEIKTDNDNLYNFTLDQIKNTLFKLEFFTLDLYSNENHLLNNIQTEYEKKFNLKGCKIKKIILKK